MKWRKIIILVILVGVVFLGINAINTIKSTQTTKGNDDTSKGNDDDSFLKCTPEQRNVDACIQIYDPVCATINVQCIRAPCNPVKETHSNSCEACRNDLVEGYILGEC